MMSLGLGLVTWMENFPHASCEVAMFFEVLWYRSVVASDFSPVRDKVIHVSRVWSSSG